MKLHIWNYVLLMCIVTFVFLLCQCELWAICCKTTLLLQIPMSKPFFLLAFWFVSWQCINISLSIAYGWSNVTASLYNLMNLAYCAGYPHCWLQSKLIVIKSFKMSNLCKKAVDKNVLWELFLMHLAHFHPRKSST